MGASNRRYTGLMECRGLVMGREGEEIRVRVSSRDCAECGACGVFSRRGGQDVEFTVLDPGSCREGDEVVLEIPGRAVLLSFLLAFGLPLSGMAAAYVLINLILLALTGTVHQGAAVGAAAVAGGFSFWWSARLAGRKVIHPRVIAVLAREPEGAREERDADRTRP